MKLNVALKIAVGFGLTLLIFLIVAFATYRSAGDLIHWADLRQEAYIALDRLDDPLMQLQDMELSSRNYFLTGDAAYLERFRGAQEKIPQTLQQLRAHFEGNSAHQQSLSDLERLITHRVEIARENMAAFRSDGLAPTVARLKMGSVESSNAEIRRVLNQLEEHQTQVLERSRANADTTARLTRQTILGGAATALLLSALAGWLIARDLSRPLASLTKAAERISVGETDVQVPAGERRDEVGVLALAFHRMTDYLRRMAAGAEQMAAGDLRTQVTPQSSRDVLGVVFERMTQELRAQIAELIKATSVLGASASQIVASTTQLAGSAAETAAAVAQTTTTVEEVRQTAEISAQKAGQVSETAQRAAQDSLGGRKATQDVEAAMTRIREQMDSIVACIARLSDASQAIGHVIATVEDLAVQSNLLAVNASIEAAKAGEHGKGFAVVAQEVRSLASQSRQATGEVRSLLVDIQRATGSAITAIQQGGQAVEAGSRQAAQASGSIQGLTGSIHEAAQMATQIAVSSQQQHVGLDQVASAMESIRQASAHNTNSARDLEGAARSLESVGQRLQQIVARYQV